MADIRTRIAPSPTGLFHIGTARTALFNYLYAKKMGGTFILRIEDTDKERSKPEFEKDIIDGLKWLGINPDEGPIRQSERTNVYRPYLEKLIAEGKVGWCDAMKEEGGMEAHWCEQHGGFNAGGKGIIRFKNTTEGAISFPDMIRDNVSFPASTIGNFSIAKDLDTPLYNFAVVVDDELMKISHVIRGEDHISNTPKQMLLIQALGFSQPVYAHLPLILGSDRSKLSKRHGATSINEFRELGYLPEAMVNFMAFLGWNPGDERELFTLSELGKEFSLEKVQKSGAVFNQEKLDWMNNQYIQKKSVPELTELCTPYLKANEPKEFIEKVITLEQPRLKKLSDIADATDYFFTEPEYDKELLRWKEMDNTGLRVSLERSKKILANLSNTASKPEIESAFLAEIGEGSKGETLWPLRAALTGKKASPSPFDIIAVLGKDTSLRRVDAAFAKLS
jgi:glutamyl-tRNA synthetase